MRRFVLTAFCTSALILGAHHPALGVSCTGWSADHTPAHGVPKQLWGALRPIDQDRIPPNRDTSDFREAGSWLDNPYFQAIDIEQDTIFVATSMRLQVWNGKTGNGKPALLGNLGLDAMGVTWGTEAHAFRVFQDVDAPDGRDDLVALAGWNGTSLMIFDTREKSLPRLLYQDHGADLSLTRKGHQVYSTVIDGRAYAFLAATQEAGGLFVYDLDAAKHLATPCIEGQPGVVASACPNVYLGRIGNRSSANFVDGVDHFVAVTSLGNPRGVEIWDVRDPLQPNSVLDALAGDVLYGVALWKQSGAYYLAVRAEQEHRIYDVSCISSGSCTPRLLWTRPASSPAQPGLGTVTFSRADGTPFLYWGSGSVCSSYPQEEWLDDVSDPRAPRDISPKDTELLSSEDVSYWSWYYRSDGEHGFNNVLPLAGKFNGQYFYRMAKGIFDVHQRTELLPPLADFVWEPQEVYAGTEVTFRDASTGLPHSWTWDFGDGAVVLSSTADEATVIFPNPGETTVTLEVENAIGFGATSRSVIVKEGPPRLVEISISPHNSFLCQPVTLRAEGVSGEPPLTYDWRVYTEQGHLVAVGEDSEAFVWRPAPPEVRGGKVYFAELALSNSQGLASFTSPLIPIQKLPDMPGDQVFVPSFDGYPTPPSSRTVQFQVDSPGATEWRWDFDLASGQGFGPWTSDADLGTSPRFTYAEAGAYLVVVEIRNCADGSRTSAPLVVNVPGPVNVPPTQQPERESRVSVSGANPGP